MASSWGEKIKISIFGGSHTEAIGAVVEGLPAGLSVDREYLLKQMQRRAPGQSPQATARQESDAPRFICGVNDNYVLSGDPICLIIENKNQRSKDYSGLRVKPRPAHADYPAGIKYHGFQDVRGGGHFSGRLTAPMVAAGALCKMFLSNHGIYIGAHAARIGSVEDDTFDFTHIDAQELIALSSQYFPVRNSEAKRKMEEEIAAIKQRGDSIGGMITCVGIGLPAGIGGPMFDGVENKLSSLLFGIPAVKGVSFGAGFSVCQMTGSQNNDPYIISNGRIETASNNAGGILGGLTTGMPLVFHVAIKPTPSISIKQRTVQLDEMQVADLEIKGRHDPCIVPRAVPVVEAAAAIALTDLYLMNLN